MSTATMNEARESGEGRATDPRISAFCDANLPDPFHAVAYASEVWQPDPFDVDAIHRGVRDALRGVVDRVIRPSGVSVGRILLILGESGAGKTHLMRAFRNEMHTRRQGYVGYLPMTAYTDDYSRYVLAHLIESLDKPYDEPRSTLTGLMRLSNAMAEIGDEAGQGALERLRETDPSEPGLDDRVRPLVDRIALDPRFTSIDYDLLQALFYLQVPNPRLKAIVLKYLRCEELSPRDREALGGLAPRVYGSASQWMILRLGELMWTVERVPLMLCVDQLEDMLDVDDAPARFRRVLATLCDITSRLPTAIIIISCLENFYDEIRRHLTQPISRRVSGGTGPLALPSACDREQVLALVARRLESLYRAGNVRFNPAEPTYPLPDALIRQLVGLGARDVLEEVGRYRAACTAKGEMAAYPLVDASSGSGSGSRELDRKLAAIEQEWNDRRARPLVVPSDETDLATILAEAIASCSAELDASGASHYETATEDRFVEVEHHGPENAVERMLIGVCNKSAQGGGLGKQIDEVIRRAGGITPVIVRSTSFPATAKSQVMQQLDKLVADGGRRLVVEDSEWRTLMALSAFRAERTSDPTFAAWQGRTRPLTRLSAIRGILGLDVAAEPGSTESTA